MSLEITLYVKTGSKSELIKFLTDNNFNKSKHFLQSMNTAEMLHFHWFGFDNYESFDGVEATVYKVSAQEKAKYKSIDWVLHTRTRASASHEDKKRQNEIIKKARQLFGGTFFNDWYGTNTYTNLEDYKKFSALEKGISMVATNALERLNQIDNCLGGYRNETTDMLKEALSNLTDEMKSMRKVYIQNDPSIVLYNGLLPFLVSVLEFFFGQCFANYIHCDKTAIDLLVEEKIKIPISDVMRIVQKESSLEQIIMQTYNFQNIESINKAYKKYIRIDVHSILSEKKKINGKIFRILPKIEELMEARHRFVHELDINYDLTKDAYLLYVKTVEHAIHLTLKAFENNGLKIELRY